MDPLKVRLRSRGVPLWRPIAAAWLLAAALAAAVPLAPTAALAATLKVDAAAASEAMRQGHWTQAIEDWRQLYIRGEASAAAPLCAIYFDARQGTFEASPTVDWCRRAAANGDAGSQYRMGMLYLVGLGVDRGIEQAQTLCAAAVGRDPQVPAGFCLAAAKGRRVEAAQAQLRLPQPPPAPAAPPPKMDGTPQQNCASAFTAAAFDAAAKWCGVAAAAGDAQAQLSQGLMRLMGVGEARDLDLARAECARARTGAKPAAAAPFCIAAAARLRQADASLAASRHADSIDVDPTTGQALPKTYGDPFAVDHALDAARTTATGLSYTCRDVIRWGQYEAPGFSILQPGDSLFGRRIVDYRAADFAALRVAADTCTKATAALDVDGSLRREFAAFRDSVGKLEARQASLATAQHEAHAEAAQIKNVDQTYRISHSALTLYSTQESACIDRVKRRWQASAKDNRHRALEISDSNRATENGRLVAYGVANVVDADTAQRQVLSISTYRCTFATGTGDIASFQLSPGFARTD